MVAAARLDDPLDRVISGVFAQPPGATTADVAGSIALTDFKRAVYKRYTHAAHLALLDEYLTQVTRFVETGGAEGIGRLIIAMPPRHGKSLTVSRLYPTWHLGRNPHHRVMLVSYGQGLANKNSRAARNIIRSKAYQALFPQTQLAVGSQSVREWNVAETDEEGGADALGVSGGATGKGAHLLIIDDPIKSREQAESETYREKIWDSYTDDLFTRLEPGGAVIVMATRWHEDDLTGRLIKRQGERFTVLSLPALAQEGDVLGRQPGEPLWAERYPLAALEEIQQTLDPYSWASLYDQNPQPSEGGILKKAWFKPYVRVVPETVRAVRYWDLAMSEKTSADFTVGLRLDEGRDGEHYIPDVARGQIELHDLPKFIKGVILSDGVRVTQGFEMKGYMTRAVQALAKDPDLRGYVIKGYDVDTDKLTRLLPAAARAALKLIHVLDKPFAETLVEEFASFPNGKYDDQVDGFSGAWRMMSEKPRETPKARRVSNV